MLRISAKPFVTVPRRCWSFQITQLRSWSPTRAALQGQIGSTHEEDSNRSRQIKEESEPELPLVSHG
jgi:hypothetical protein